MSDIYSSDFTEIPAVLSRNAELRAAVEKLIRSEPIPGKALEGGSRLDALRGVLLDLTNGRALASKTHTRKLSERCHGPARPMRTATGFSLKTGESVLCVHTLTSSTPVPSWKNCAQRATTGSSCHTPRLRSQTLHVRRGWPVPIKICRHCTIAPSPTTGTASDELKIPHHPHCTHTVKPPQ